MSTKIELKNADFGRFILINTFFSLVIYLYVPAHLDLFATPQTYFRYCA